MVGKDPRSVLGAGELGLSRLATRKTGPHVPNLAMRRVASKTSETSFVRQSRGDWSPHESGWRTMTG